MKTGIELIAEERSRHESKGYDAQHDAGHINGELAAAGASYALCEWSRTTAESVWPFEPFDGLWPMAYDPPHTLAERIKILSIAGSFIAAEIDRLQNLG